MRSSSKILIIQSRDRIQYAFLTRVLQYCYKSWLVLPVCFIIVFLISQYKNVINRYLVHMFMLGTKYKSKKKVSLMSEPESEAGLLGLMSIL